MTDDGQLLHRYASEGSEEAFAELVRRRVDFVYGAALRQTRGNAALAEDITQAVFTDLAHKAGALAGHEVLVGWLHTATRYAAGKAVRAESRRKLREREAGVMSETSGEEVREWERLRPVIDEAMGELKERERVAILLRFFEKKPLAEVGGALALTETAARSCVDRALDKLRAALERRGIASTASALGAALGNQVAVAAPAGLSVSVTGAALAQATGAGGLAVAAGFFGFMSTAKIMGVVGIALALSVAANVYLATQAAEPEGRAEQTAVAVAAPAPGRTEAVALPALLRGDLAALRDRLRAEGANEATTRGVVEGVLRRRYRETLSTRRAEQMRHGWWNDTAWWWKQTIGDGPPKFADDTALLREMVLDPLEKLFGPDPVEVAELEARYAFLPAEKRRAVVELEREYEAAYARMGAPGEKAGSPGAELKRVREEKLKGLLAGLTAGERAEYELRFSPTAVTLRERMSQIGASEQEYRTIMGVVASPDNDVRAARAAPDYWEREQRALAQVVAALGYDRALDYIWAGAWEYPSYARAAQDAGLPANTAGRVLQLAAESTVRAMTIHDDPTLTPEQKRAAVIALQQEVRPKLDALLPSAQQRKLNDQAMTWFTALGQGRYKMLPTSPAGNVGGIISPGTIAVETPLTGPRARRQYVVPRPGGD